MLVYTTPPLAEDVEVTGPLSATLYVATSAPTPTSRPSSWTSTRRDAYNVSDGIFRRRYAASDRPGRPPSRCNRDLTLADQHGVPAGTSHQAGGRGQQFSAVRSQPQYRTHRSRRRPSRRWRDRPCTTGRRRCRGLSCRWCRVAVAPAQGLEPIINRVSITLPSRPRTMNAEPAESAENTAHTKQATTAAKSAMITEPRPSRPTTCWAQSARRWRGVCDRRRPPHESAAMRLWAHALAATAVGSFAGGTYHGFNTMLPAPLGRAIWAATTIVVGMAACLLLSATLTAAVPRTARRWLLAVVWGQFAVYAAWMLRHDAFVNVIVEYGLAMLFVLLLHVAAPQASPRAVHAMGDCGRGAHVRRRRRAAERFRSAPAPQSQRSSASRADGGRLVPLQGRLEPPRHSGMIEATHDPAHGCAH